MLRAAGGQVRTIGRVVVGLDMGALLALGAALNACPVTLGEILAEVEPDIVEKINEPLRSGEDG